MRLILFGGMLLIAHSINPNIVTLYEKDMHPIILSYMITLIVLAIILDAVDLWKKLDK